MQCNMPKDIKCQYKSWLCQPATGSSWGSLPKQRQPLASFWSMLLKSQSGWKRRKSEDLEQMCDTQLSAQGHSHSNPAVHVASSDWSHPPWMVHTGMDYKGTENPGAALIPWTAFSLSVVAGHNWISCFRQPGIEHSRLSSERCSWGRTGFPKVFQ